MATKRRQVWVNEYDADDDGLGDIAWPSKRLAQKNAMHGAKHLVFVERLPGDVVLSREDVAELKELVQANLSPTRPHGTDGRILALLRGRR